MSYRFEFRTYLSIHFLETAKLFCGSSFKLESRYIEDAKNITGEFKNELSRNNMSYVIGVIISCVNFLEANINEMFCDAVDGSHNDRLKPLTSESIKIMGNMWDYIERESILNKYEIALKLAGKESFNKGSEPYQSVNLLIKLRNELVHYKTKTVESSSFGSDKKDNIEKKYSNLFANSLFTKTSANPYFPDKCLGYGCARWALNSVVNFTDFYYENIGIKPYYEHIRDEIDIDELKDINKDILNGKSKNKSKESINKSKEVISVAPVEVTAELIEVDDL